MKRILVVDDDPALLDMVAFILEAFNYRVERAKNGAEALEQIRQDPPDAVLLDLMMPVMDGWAFLEARRSDVVCSQVPVAVMSARHDAASAIDLGARAVIRKPFDATDLVATVEGVM